MKDGKHVILYVDDDEDLLHAMNLVLDKHGYSMVSASTAEEGLKKYKETQPDLIIVDLMMEEIDAGTSLVRDLKAEGNAAPIYMLSSMGDTLNIQASGADLGLAGIFQKPIDNKKLIDILEKKLKK